MLSAFRTETTTQLRFFLVPSVAPALSFRALRCTRESPSQRFAIIHALTRFSVPSLIRPVPPPNHRVELLSSRKTAIGISIFLTAITWIVFGQTLGHQFVNYDDPEYVLANPMVNGGLSLRGLVWAFTHSHSSNWHPVTWISHMLDCQFFGLNPGGHHFTSVFLHTIAVLLLFLLLRQMTGTLWRSAFVAAIFAIHPLRVESVAWVAERKDVLSGVFFLLTLIAYVRYTRGPSLGRYLSVSILFALGLMSKPMLVTIPAVLLLLDYWPLNRQSGWRKLALEKIPLFGLPPLPLSPRLRPRDRPSLPSHDYPSRHESPMRSIVARSTSGRRSGLPDWRFFIPISDGLPFPLKSLPHLRC